MQNNEITDVYKSKKANDFFSWGEIPRVRWSLDWMWIVENSFGGRRDLNLMEVGIGPLDISALPFWAGKGFISVHGVEPHPQNAKTARDAMPDVIIHEYAVTEKPCVLNMTDNGGSSGVIGNWMPTSGSGSIEVLGVDFPQIEGDIRFDVMNIDCEGGEWDVLSTMKSRPKILGVELWANYPRYDDCMDLICSMGYELLISSGPTGETLVFYK